MTGVLAKELGPRKIRVNSINPGLVETEGAHAGGWVGSDFVNGLIAQTKMAASGNPMTFDPSQSSWLRTISAG